MGVVIELMIQVGRIDARGSSGIVDGVSGRKGGW